jgi:drug/metabolite transporter (DMT)-like permease
LVGTWRRRIALVAGTIALLSSPPLLIRNAGADLVTLLVTRFAVQSLLLALLRVRVLGTTRVAASRGATRRSSVAGVAFALYLLCFFASLTETSIERAILLSSLYVVVVVLTRWMGRSAVRSGEAVGALLVVAGVAVGVLGGRAPASRGDALAAASAILFAAYILASAPRLRAGGWGDVLDHQAVVSFVGLLLTALLLAARWANGTGPVAAAVPVGALLGALGALGHIALSRVQTLCTVAVTATTAAMSPIVAGVVGAALFNRAELTSSIFALTIASAGFFLVSTSTAPGPVDHLRNDVGS